MSGYVGFVVGKWHWGSISSSTSVSPINSHSIGFFTFIIIYHPGLVQ
jgi:hypothetical protein